MREKLGRDIETRRDTLAHDLQEGLQMILRHAFQGFIDAAQTAGHRNDGEFSAQIKPIEGVGHAPRKLGRNQKRSLVSRQLVEQRIDGRSIVNDQRERNVAGRILRRRLPGCWFLRQHVPGGGREYRPCHTLACQLQHLPARGVARVHESPRFPLSI